MLLADNLKYKSSVKTTRQQMQHENINIKISRPFDVADKYVAAFSEDGADCIK